MNFNSFDSLLITNPTNIRYLTGFVGAAPEEREAYVLLTKQQTYLFTNALYLEAAKKTHTAVIEISRENPFAKKLGDVLTKGMRVGFEENNLTVSEYHKIMHEYKFVILVPTEGRVEALRMIKREDEIENIRAAAKITDECFDFMIEKIKSGISESDISREIETFIRTRGAQLAFSPIVAFGEHTSQPHYNLARHSLAASQWSTIREQNIALYENTIQWECSPEALWRSTPKTLWYDGLLPASLSRNSGRGENEIRQSAFQYLQERIAEARVIEAVYQPVKLSMVSKQKDNIVDRELPRVYSIEKNLRFPWLKGE